MTVPVAKRVRRRVRAQALRALMAILRFVPLKIALWLGRGIGRVAHAVAGKERRLARAHLRLAFPEASEAFVEGTARGCFVRLGEHLMEDVCIRQVDRRMPGWVRFDDADRAILEAAIAEGRGVVVVTGHVGNWELAARALVHFGYDMAAIAKESHDPGLGRIIESLRESGGVRTLYRGEKTTAVKMLRQFQRGGGLCMLVDQDTDVPSVVVPFFGMPAKTPRAPADLCLRTGAALVAGFLHRQRPGGNHQLVFRRITVESTGDKEADAERVTAKVNEEIEAEIRAHPEDWVWFHERWRSTGAADQVGSLNRATSGT